MGCASSQPEPSQTKPAPKPNTAPGPSASQPKLEPVQSPVKPQQHPQPSQATVKSGTQKQAPVQNEEDDLQELDRLLQGTKSQIQERPLDLYADDAEAKVISPKPAKQPSLQQRVSPSRVLSPPREDLPEQPATPPLPQQIASPAKPAAPPPNIPDDPWASLQAAYAVQGSAMDTLDSPDAHKSSKRPDLRAGNSWGKGNGKGPGGATPDMMVFDEDGDDVQGQGQAQPLYGRQPLRAHVSAQPKQGGWGQGKMAQAGTLMVGDDELMRLAPPKATAASAPMVDEDAEFEKIKQRIKANQAVADLGVEDIEDIDELIRQEEARSGLSAGLAAKLAAFEALDDD